MLVDTKSDKDRAEHSRDETVETRHDLGLLPMLLAGLLMIVVGGVVVMAFV